MADLAMLDNGAGAKRLKGLYISERERKRDGDRDSQSGRERERERARERQGVDEREEDTERGGCRV